MGKIVTVGEPMALFVANEEGDLDTVKSFTKYIAGAEINVSVGVTRLEHKIEYVTQLGKDPFGKYIARFLEDEGIGTTYSKFYEGAPTGFQLKGKDQENDPEVFYFRKNSAASMIPYDLSEEISLDDVDVLHVSGVFLAVNDETYRFAQNLVKRAKAKGITIVFDPNLRPVLWGSTERMVKGINEMAVQADYVLPGLSEGEILTGSSQPNEIAEFYLAQGVKGVIIKDGSLGCYAYEKQADATKKTVAAGFKLDQLVDTVGAGDGFAVGIVTGLIEELPLDAMLERANAIGAIQVSHISDNEGLPTRQELADFIETHSKIS